MELKFKSEVELEYEGPEGKADSKIEIDWLLCLETREYGVKSMVVIVPEQTISFGVTNENGHESDVTLNLKDIDVETIESMKMISPWKLSFEDGQGSLFLEGA